MHHNATTRRDFEKNGESGEGWDKVPEVKGERRWRWVAFAAACNARQLESRHEVIRYWPPPPVVGSGSPFEQLGKTHGCVRLPSSLGSPCRSVKSTTTHHRHHPHHVEGFDHNPRQNDRVQPIPIPKLPAPLAFSCGAPNIPTFREKKNPIHQLPRQAIERSMRSSAEFLRPRAFCWRVVG